MLVEPHDGAVDQHVLEIGIDRQFLENALEDAFQRPSSEALEHRVPQPELVDTIYTTNFDQLLEDANGLVHKPFRSLVGELQLPFHGGPLITNIVKMHGDLQHEEHIVVTQEDYDEFLLKYPVISTHLSAMLIIRTPLFLGYSLTDPDFLHIRDVVRSRLGKFQRMSYIIQFDQSPEDIEKHFDDRLHVINIKPVDGQSRATALASFFCRTQEELGAKSSQRFRDFKPEAFEEISSRKLLETSRSSDASMLLSSSSNLCFVSMPYSKTSNEIFKVIVEPAVLQTGLETIRMEQLISPGMIMEEIRASIQHSRLVIVLLAEPTSAVLYEMGIARALNKPYIVLIPGDQQIPTDLGPIRVVKFDGQFNDAEETRANLVRAIALSLGADRLDEARRLVESGSVRAGVALMGMLLEQTLRHLLISADLVDVRLRDSFSRRLTMSRSLQKLFRAGKVTGDEEAKLHRAIKVRNRAVHDLREPDKRDALEIYEDISAFVQAQQKND